MVTGGGLTFQVGLAEGAAGPRRWWPPTAGWAIAVPEQRDSIAEDPAPRRRAIRSAYSASRRPAAPTGLSRRRPDGLLRRGALPADGDPGAFAGAVGLQNAFARCLRQVRPTRVFLPTSADLHPDHRIVHEEMLISLFHAQGAIWPELGEPIAEVPAVYEYAVYCDFPEPPQIRIETPDAMLRNQACRHPRLRQPGANRNGRGDPAGRRAGRVSPRVEVPLLPPAAVPCAFREEA